MPSSSTSKANSPALQKQEEQLKQQHDADSNTAHANNAGGGGGAAGGAAKHAIARYASFDDMPIDAAILRGIYSSGFEAPTEIQQVACVPVAEGGDVIVQACAGSGKTAAFGIGALSRIDTRVQRQQVLVLEPTRELAQQTYEVIDALGTYFLAASRNPVALLSGATKVKDDVAALGGGAAVAVGTPGRVCHLLRCGALRTDRLKTLVLDEADELFSQGFSEQVADVFRYLPKDIQIVLVSATMPAEVVALSDQFMRAGATTRIMIERQQIPVEAIRQFYVAVDAAEDKLAVLEDLYESISVSQSIIFVNSRRKAEFVASHLNSRSFAVSLTHGDLSREERDDIFQRFRRGETRVLVTTDLLGRGVDVMHVNMVINYELPPSLDKYVHRIGRCGRCGRKGVAINLVAAQETHLVREVEQAFSVIVSELPMNFAMFTE